MDDDCAAAATRFLSSAEEVAMRLSTLQSLVGEDAYPRAFTDIGRHLAAIKTKATEAKRHPQDGTVGMDNAVRLQAAFQGCERQLQQLLSLLDRCLPGGRNAAKKGATKVLKDIFAEKDIPRIQKTLLGYERSLS